MGVTAESDIATFSNLDPHTSEANALGGDTTRVIWGTNISIQDSLSAARDFLRNFQKKYRLIQDGELLEATNLPADHPGTTKSYMQMMQTMMDLGVTTLNLDLRDLKAYPPTRKMWHQFQNYPQEMVPIFDNALRDCMIEIAGQRMHEARQQMQHQGQRPQQRGRDGSSLPPAPSSELDAPTPMTVDGLGPDDLPDLVHEVEARLYKIRPFNMDTTINLRDLNPSGK